MNKKVPKRRFSGFNEDWENIQLKDYYEFYKGKGLPLSSFSENGKYLGIAYGHLYTKYSEVINNVIKKVDSKSFSSIKGDILFPGSSTVPLGTAQANALMETNVQLGGDVIVARDITNSNYSPFMSYMINSQKEKMFTITTGTTIAHMYGKDIEELNYNIPSLKEQEQIGDFFQKLDNMIELQSDKIKKYKMLKESYLEKLLPEETKVNPELRFVDFSDPYKLNIIKEVLNVSTGSSNTQDQSDNGLYPFYIRSEEAVKSNKYLYDEEAVITIGDGKIGEVFHYVNGKYDLHQRCYRIYGFDKVHGKYFFNYFSKHFFDRVMRMSAKGTVDSVRMDMIADMPIRYPKLDEQKAIGNFFSKLDNIIELQNKKLNKLKSLKKAYLNEMFVN